MLIVVLRKLFATFLSMVVLTILTMASISCRLQFVVMALLYLVQTTVGVPSHLYLQHGTSQKNHS